MSSFEAARAGVHGKGFSVVAGEIKKLAENTKSQIEFIQNVVSDLTKKIDSAADMLEEVTRDIEYAKGAVSGTTENISGIVSSLDGINSSFMEINAATEEQSSATEEISANLMVVNEKSHDVRREVVRTGKAFYDISNMVDDIRLEGINNSDHIDHRIQIEICICDHLMWRWRVYNMLLGNVELSESEVGTHKTCRLGKWVENQDKKDTRLNSLLSELEKPHAELHELAKKAIREYLSGNIASAEDSLDKMDVCSKRVIEVLKKIKAV